MFDYTTMPALKLNADSIHRANDASQFNAGDQIAREAENVYRSGLERMFSGLEDLNPQQEELAASRAESWRDLCEKAYNDIIARRASWMPWTVCGPAKYNGKKNSDRCDAQMRAAAEWSDKQETFIVNTVSMLHNAKPAAEIIQEYRSGKRADPISGDDPAAPEKLQARIDFLKEEHEAKKAKNAYWRKHGTMKGYPGISDARAVELDAEIKQQPLKAWQVPCPIYGTGTANIRRLEQRLKEISALREKAAEPSAEGDREYAGFTVNKDMAAGRLNIDFPDKPSAEAREILKGNGFHWSPKAKVWTRQLTNNALWSLEQRVIPALLKLDEYRQQEPEDLTPEEFAEEINR